MGIAPAEDAPVILGCLMDFVTIAVIGIIVAAYAVGSLTSSVETETKLPHNYR